MSLPVPLHTDDLRDKIVAMRWNVIGPRHGQLIP